MNLLPGWLSQLLRVFGLPLIAAFAHAAEVNTITDFYLDRGEVIVQFANDPNHYYLLQYSEDMTHWTSASMSLGDPSQLQIVPGVDRGFYRAIPYDIYAPLDTDGDGIDDVYELNHRDILNPLDPSDALKIAPSSGGLTNLQVYLNRYQITTYQVLQQHSHEVTVFNFGSSLATVESNSREQSVFNFGNPTKVAVSREISLYNGSSLPTSPIAGVTVSREWSAFNFGSAAPGSDPNGIPALSEAISRNVSIYNGQAVPVSDLNQMQTRELSVFNYGSVTAAREAISRELSIYNNSNN